MKPWDHLRKSVEKPPIGAGKWKTSNGCSVEVCFSGSNPTLAFVSFHDCQTNVFGAETCMEIGEFLLELGEQLKGEI